MTNKTLYFLSQTYRQIQLSVEKGTTPYPHSDFAHQFDALLNAVGEEAARALAINLVEEAATANENTDYFRRRMAEAAEV
ncbi:hypothetical protein [Spirosoma rhododendri]|uniref:Uncharacterized protein n=1 Tax=Spirosoma rhododendri TaxID=2728024 RepID=A0A7L5DKR6_9BACT|nr:hypothetical protein [Spirosoma rhododendri]QJD79074.1 hypothetical protein HH216_12060 [Spirosoma rhododendri]